jgi:hypothetical protein
MPSGVPLYFGRVFGSYIRNLAAGERARVDFVYQANCVAPQGSILNIPGEATNNVHIRCDGPALVQYSVNDPNINEMYGGILAPAIARELKWPDTVVKSVNLLCLDLNGSISTAVAVECSK